MDNAYLLLLLALLPLVAFFQVAISLYIGAFHPNRMNLRPHLSRFGWGLALFFASFFFLPRQMYAHDLGTELQLLYLGTAVALSLYDFWILLFRNRIGLSKSSEKNAPSGQVPFFD